MPVSLPLFSQLQKWTLSTATKHFILLISGCDSPFLRFPYPIKIAGDHTLPNHFPPRPAHFLGGTHFPRFFHQESNQTRTKMIGPCWTNQYCPFRKNRGNHFLYLLVVEWWNPLLINEFTVLIGKVRASALKWLCWVMPTEKVLVPFRVHTNDEGHFQTREVAVRLV